MKSFIKCLALFSVLLGGLISKAQAQFNDDHPWSVTVNLLNNQYEGDFADEILNNLYQESDWGFEIQLKRSINENWRLRLDYVHTQIDYRLDVSRDYFSRFPAEDLPTQFETQWRHLRLGADLALFDFKKINTQAYGIGGLGVAFTTQSGEFSDTGTDTDVIQMPIHLGVGFEKLLTDKFFISTEFVYHILTGSARDNIEGRVTTNGVDGQYGARPSDRLFTATIGAGFKFGKPKDTDKDGIYDKDDACPLVPGIPEFEGCPDTDGDGIQDSEDACPLVAGIPEFQGCPDTDSDGIQDSLDACPLVAGLPEFDGCPDSDGDGIQDSKDDCPQTPGLAEFNGCPDTDGDGIMDKEDACPTVAGIAEFQGCPDTDADGIQDSKDLCPTVPGIPSMEGCAEYTYNLDVDVAEIPNSELSKLDALVEDLKANSSFMIVIKGHTDASASERYNEGLGLRRADMAKAYLIEKGIEEARISTQSFGETMPIADNETEEGRSKNRRVEIILELKQ